MRVERSEPFSTHTDVTWSRTRLRPCGVAAIIAIAGTVAVIAAGQRDQGSTSTPTIAPESFAALRWRSVGPMRGGRSIAAIGISGRPNQYYFGATGGGLWKTDNGGTTWAPIGDGQFASSSVGAIEACESNPDIVFIGFGEVQLRGDIIPGDGIYRTTDGGRTWSHVGLRSSTGQQTIGRIRVDPVDCNRVYAAVFGDPFGPSSERGVFRSLDGGQTWTRVLSRSDRAGAVDLSLARKDSKVLYAAFWEAYRNEWSLSSGGAGSGLFKSADGGDTWTELTRNPGLPRDLWGKVGVSVSGPDPNRVYANIEARDGGVFVSDDGGATWRLASADRNLRTRAFYYTRLTADPQERDTVYVNNESFWRSRDGGRTWEEIIPLHGDNHDLWIDPANNQRLIHANDGGASVSVDAGRTWTRQQYPTAQMYSARTTHDFPYHICGNQQDQGAGLCLPSDGDGTWFYAAGGGESGWVVPDPDETAFIYAGAQTGVLTRFDRRIAQQRVISPWPIRPVGRSAADVQERYQWQMPIALSPLEPRVLYVGSQHLWRSKDRGISWDRISPDLTYADPKTLGPSGGPIMLDRTTVEHYATIFAIAASHHDPGTIWVGSDDGLVHLTRDGGANWLHVTPPAVPKFSRVSTIESSPHEPGKALVAITRYRMQDVAPYLWKTTDYGKTWVNAIAGIAVGDHVRTVVEDPVRKGLLFAGTETRVYVSFDDGASWHSFQQNLPISPVYSLTIKDNDLIAATHGRGFYVLDDITPLRQLSVDTLSSTTRLFRPADAIRNKSLPVGYNRKPGVGGSRIYYYLSAPAQHVTVDILDASGTLVRRLTRAAEDAPAVVRRRAVESAPPALDRGLNVIRWDLLYPGFTRFPGLQMRFSAGQGPMSPPGEYQVQLTVDGVVIGTERFTVKADPRITHMTSADYQHQFRFAMQVRDKTSQAHEAVIRVRQLRDEVNDRLSRMQDRELRSVLDAFVAAIGAIEREIYETRLQAPEDQLNFGLKINNDLSSLLVDVESGDAVPTAQQRAVFADLSNQLGSKLTALDAIIKRDLPLVNAGLKRAALPAITAPRPASPPRP